MRLPYFLINMKLLHSFKRIATLFIAILLVTGYSYGKEYKLTWGTSTIGWHQNYYFTYNSSNPTKLTIVLQGENTTTTLLDATGVKARVVDGTWLSNNGYLNHLRKPFKNTKLYSADKGIAFSKDGKDICVMFYGSGSKDVVEYTIRVIYYSTTFKELRSFPAPEVEVQTQAPSLSVYNAMLAEIEKTSPRNASVNNPAPSTTQKPAPAAKPKPAAQPDNTPYRATVSNPKYVIRQPGTSYVFPFQMFYEVTNSRPMMRYDYLYVQNADTFELYKDPTTGKPYVGITDSNEPLLTFIIENEQMPKASPSNPLRLKIWIFMNTPGSQEWIGEFSTPVYIWDGTYLRRE